MQVQAVQASSTAVQQPVQWVSTLAVSMGHIILQTGNYII